MTKSVFKLLGLDLPVASVATLCRRRKALSIEPWARGSSEPLDLVLDGTGLRVFGQGEWCRAKHGEKRRGWKKLHVGLAATSAWQKAHDHGRRSLVETTMGRHEPIIGGRLHARHDDAQPVEAAMASRFSTE